MDLDGSSGEEGSGNKYQICTRFAVSLWGSMCLIFTILRKWKKAVHLFYVGVKHPDQR